MRWTGRHQHRRQASARRDVGTGGTSLRFVQSRLNQNLEAKKQGSHSSLRRTRCDWSSACLSNSPSQLHLFGVLRPEQGIHFLQVSRLWLHVRTSFSSWSSRSSYLRPILRVVPQPGQRLRLLRPLQDWERPPLERYHAKRNVVREPREDEIEPVSPSQSLNTRTKAAKIAAKTADLIQD